MKYKADPRLKKLVNKQVGFQFHGEKLKFDLSMGLFSSFDVDAGSRLLLKTLAKEAPLQEYSDALDTGCGTGVLGLSLKKKYPGLHMKFQDRDALAVHFTAHNAGLNGISLDQADLETGLLLDNTEKESLDLILCNIPAKAGDHVIRDFIFKASRTVKAEGRVAVVIVDTLKDVVAQAISDCGARVLHTEATKMHSVYHFSQGTKDKDLDFNRYIRHTGSFKLVEDTYELSTVYNLPDFDQLSFWLHVSGELLCHSSFSGRALFWNPGQGHLPVWLNSRNNNHFKSIELASRDSLQTKITAHNLAGSFKGEVKAATLPDESWLIETYGKDGFDCIFLNLNPIPKVKWHEDLARTALELTRKGKFCFIMGRSSDMSQLDRHLQGFKTLQDDRFKGNRGILLRKN
ncbi:MAG: methyltransferase [Spirochaetales bacterium]|nr:methyltransferase [Spirochaetales bacterium]